MKKIVNYNGFFIRHVVDILLGLLPVVSKGYLRLFVCLVEVCFRFCLFV